MVTLLNITVDGLTIRLGAITANSDVKPRAGESLVGDGNEVAHIDLIIGPRGSAVEKAFANCLTNNKPASGLG